MYYQNMYDNNYLMHYGVKGMKWGVRRQQRISSRMRRAANRYDAKASRLMAKGTKRSIKKAGRLSDKAKSARSYKGYSKGDGFLKNAGRNYVQSFKDGGTFYKDAANSVARGRGLNGIKKAYKKWGDTPVNVLGYTGYQKMSRRNYNRGNYYMWY